MEEADSEEVEEEKDDEIEKEEKEEREDEEDSAVEGAVEDAIALADAESEVGAGRAVEVKGASVDEEEVSTSVDDEDREEETEEEGEEEGGFHTGGAVDEDDDSLPGTISVRVGLNVSSAATAIIVTFVELTSAIHPFDRHVAEVWALRRVQLDQRMRCCRCCH